MANDDEREDDLYVANTIPPPDGESDAYNAPTKVGTDAWAALVGEQQRVPTINAVPPPPAPPERDATRRAQQTGGVAVARGTAASVLPPVSTPPPKTDSLHRPDRDSNSVSVRDARTDAPGAAPLAPRTNGPSATDLDGTRLDGTRLKGTRLDGTRTSSRTRMLLLSLALLTLVVAAVLIARRSGTRIPFLQVVLAD